MPARVAAAAGAPRSSLVLAPVAIALSAIRDAAEHAAQRTLHRQGRIPVSQILETADIGWNGLCGADLSHRRAGRLPLSTLFTGTLNVIGSLSRRPRAVGDAIGGLFGGDIGKRIGGMTSRI